MKFQTAYARGIEDGQRKMREDWCARIRELTDLCKERLMQRQENGYDPDFNAVEESYLRGVHAGAVVANTTLLGLLQGKNIAEMDGQQDSY